MVKDKEGTLPIFPCYHGHHWHGEKNIPNKGLTVVLMKNTGSVPPTVKHKGHAILRINFIINKIKTFVSVKRITGCVESGLDICSYL